MDVNLETVPTGRLILELAVRMSLLTEQRLSSGLSEEPQPVASSLAISILASVLPNALEVLPSEVLNYTPEDDGSDV